MLFHLVPAPVIYSIGLSSWRRVTFVRYTMTKILQLEDFTLTKLHIDWHSIDDSESQQPVAIETEISVSYDVKRHKERPNTFLLKLLFSDCPLGKKTKQGIELHAEILGLFHFPEGMSEDEMQTLIRINGGTILYGILRGEIASLTGSFPSGKVVLPTIHMPEIVEAVEKKKKADALRRSRSGGQRARAGKKAR